MDIHYRYNRNEEVISILLKFFQEFKKDYTIPITYSDETPPIFHEGPEFEGKENEGKLPNYPFEGLMGAYFPETRNIVIYLQGINKTTNDLSGEIKIRNLFENLMIIVILHEIGHYWYNNVKFSSVEPTAWFDDPWVNEWIAQMFVFQCIKDDEMLKTTMIKLSNSQSEIYQSFNCKNEMSIDLFKKIIEKIRKTSPEERTYSKLMENEKIKRLIEGCKYNL